MFFSNYLKKRAVPLSDWNFKSINEPEYFSSIIVIPSYAESDYIIKTLTSIDKQTNYDLSKLLVIVVVNNSKSESGKILKNKAKPKDFSDDVKRALENGLAALKDLEKEYPGLTLVGTEVKVELPLKSLVKYKKDDLIFKGKIDALYKHNSGYLEVDWKSSKNDSDNDVVINKRQLSVYKKMYSIDKKIPEDKIKTCLIYVALRGNISIGKFGRTTYTGSRDAQVFKTFEKHLQKILEWRKDPKKFIKEFIDIQVKQPLILILQHKLKKEIKALKTKPKKRKPKKS